MRKSEAFLSAAVGIGSWHVCCVAALGAVLPSGPIALTGSAGALGPDQGSATYTYLNNGTPSINIFNQIAFRGQTSAQPATGDTSGLNFQKGTAGVWLWSAGANAIRAEVGTPSPDGPNYSFTSAGGGFTAAQLADSGAIYYRTESNANFVQSPAATINRASGTVPGIAGAQFSATSPGTVMLAGNGNYMLQASLLNAVGGITNTGVNRNDSGLWLGSGGSLTLAFQRNMALDALTGGTTPAGAPTSFTGVRMGSAATGAQGAYNANGVYMTVVTGMQGSVVSTSGPTLNNTAIFSNLSGSLQAIARAGDVAPGTNLAQSTTYANFGQVALNNNNHFAYGAGLRNGADTFTTGAVYSNHQGGGVQLVARRGEAVPASLNYPAGTLWGSGTTTVGTINPIALSSADHLLISVAGLTGPSITSSTNNALVVSDSGGNWTSVARSGELSPASSPVAGETVSYSVFQGGAINSLGQVAFLANIVGSLTTGSGIVTNQNNRGLFARDQYGATFLVVQDGSPFQVAPGDIRTVLGGGAGFAAGGVGNNLTVALGSGGQDGRANCLSESGLLTFALAFTDGTSGVFTTQIPAPGAGAVLGLGVLVASRRRRR